MRGDSTDDANIATAEESGVIDYGKGFELVGDKVFFHGLIDHRASAADDLKRPGVFWLLSI